VDDAQFDFLTRLVHADQHRELFSVDDQLVIDFDEHVELLQTCLGRRAVRGDLVDRQRGCGGEFQLSANILRHRLCLNSEKRRLLKFGASRARSGRTGPPLTRTARCAVAIARFLVCRHSCVRRGGSLHICGNGCGIRLGIHRILRQHQTGHCDDRGRHQAQFPKGHFHDQSPKGSASAPHNHYAPAQVLLHGNPQNCFGPARRKF